MAQRQRFDSTGNKIDYVISDLGLRILHWTIILCLGIVFAGLLVGGSKFFQYAKEAPALNTDKLTLSIPSVIKDSNGATLMKVGAEDRVTVSEKEVPQAFTDALVSTEDRRFYQHNGFDVIRIGKSAILSVMAKFGLGGSRQGGSTLTQQLVKLSFLDQTDISLKRKAQEAYLSWQLEKKYTKGEILNMYENKVYMGDGVYGIGTASKYYFGKPLNQLSVPQLALLAGKPNDPNGLDPYTQQAYVKQRRDIVLLSMYNNNKITKEDYQKYTAVPITTGLKPKKDLVSEFKSSPSYYNYLTHVVEEAQGILGKEALYNGGYTINTALDKNKQNYANQVVQTNNILYHPNTDIIYSFAVLDTHTGRVLTEASGNTGKLNKYVVGGFDYATDIKRQAGSTMKPILAYAPAIEYLDYNTGTMVQDETSYTWPASYGGGTLYNYDKSSQGNETIRRALAGSRNIPAVKIELAVGLDKAYDFANKLGFGYTQKERVPAGVLGGVSIASPLKMAQAYATFANNGVYNKAHYIKSIQDSDGNSWYMEPDGKQAMDSSTAYMTADMLRDAVSASYGVSNHIKANGIDIAGKTGTTNYTDDEYAKFGFWQDEVPDTWAVGTNSNYTIAVWVGYDKRSQGVTSSQVNICQQLVSTLFTKYSNGDPGTINQPDTVYSQGGELYKNN